MPIESCNQRIPKTDYDIHGIVGVRLIDALPSDVRTVSRQIGPMQAPLSREPEIVIRFHDHLPTRNLRIVEYSRTGFTDDGFFVLQSGKRPAKVRVPFESIGRSCVIDCESGLAAIPYLMAIVNLTALAKDVVSLHASGFVYNDTGVIVTGWAKGGKTEALLSFAAAGATYVGDEWLLLSGDGKHMYGIPEHIRLWKWHIENVPRLRAQLGLDKRMLFGSIGVLEWLDRAMPGGVSGALPRRMLHDAMPALKRQLNVRYDPKAIFQRSIGRHAERPDKVFLMMNHDDGRIVVQRIAAREVAERMISSVRFEQSPIMGDYLAFKFAFPGVRNELLERASDLQYGILCRALEGKEAHAVFHPYPVNFGELFQAMRPYVSEAVIDSWEQSRRPFHAQSA